MTPKAQATNKWDYIKLEKYRMVKGTINTKRQLTNGENVCDPHI